MFKKSKKTTVLVAIISIQLLATCVLIGMTIMEDSSHKRFVRTNPPAVPPFDVEVLYTDDGFQPSLLEIPLGSRVAFRNMTGHPLRAAADPLFKHSDYPEFDSQRDYAGGEIYIFKFERRGTFGFNNDLNSKDHGVIHVPDSNVSEDEIGKTPEHQLKIRDHLLTILDPGNVRSIFGVIDLISSDSTLALNCHSLAHDLGHHAYELYGFSSAMNVADPTRANGASIQDVCAGGFVHGILEEAAQYWPDFDSNPESLCDGVTTANRSNCLHGLGHAFMYNLGRDVSLSLSECRSFSKTNDKYPCFEGVWMEFFSGSIRSTDLSVLGWDPSKPLEPCKDIQVDAKPACFLYSSMGYLRTHGQNHVGAIQLCTSSGLSAADAQYCLKGIGITMFGRFKGKKLERVEPIAASLDSEQKLAFYKGLVGYANFSGVSKEDLKGTCDALENDGEICEIARTALN